MTCRTFTQTPRKAADGRIIIDREDQFEEEDYHKWEPRVNHTMTRRGSTTQPGWVDLTCACGMRVTIEPDIAAKWYRDAENDGEDAPSYVVLWDRPYDGNPDDIKTSIKCRFCETTGFAYFSQADLDELPQPVVFECFKCSKQNTEIPATA